MSLWSEAKENGSACSSIYHMAAMPSGCWELWRAVHLNIPLMAHSLMIVLVLPAALSSWLLGLLQCSENQLVRVGAVFANLLF